MWLAHKFSRRVRCALLLVLASTFAAITGCRWLDEAFFHEDVSFQIRDARPIVIYEFGYGAPVSAAFLMKGNGLHAIDVQLSADRMVTLEVICELRRTDFATPALPRAPIYKWTTTIDRVSHTEWRRIEFPRLEKSDNQAYWFRVQLLNASKERSRPRIGISASEDNPARGGILWIGDTRHTGSLYMKAHGGGETRYERLGLKLDGRIPPSVSPKAHLTSITSIRRKTAEIGLLVRFAVARKRALWALSVHKAPVLAFVAAAGTVGAAYLVLLFFLWRVGLFVRFATDVWPVNALYFLCACLAMIALLEVAVRLMGMSPVLPEQYSRNVVDPVLPWKPEPRSLVEGRTDEFEFSYRHNSFGFRDVEHSLSKPPNTFRLLALGDSFTYGVGAVFEQTFLYRLEQMLNDHLHGRPNVEVIKAGIPRYWPEPERLLLEHYGIEYSPDLIVVAFLPNDVLDTYNGLKELAVTQGFLIQHGLKSFGAIGVWLYVHSQLFRNLAVPYLEARLDADSAKPAARLDEIYRANGYHESDWRKIESEFDRMSQLSVQVSARLAIVFVPQQGPWPTEFSNYPQQRLAKWAVAHGALFIDTLPALRAAGSDGLLYYQRDGHCTPAGYEIIARTIYDHLLASEISFTSHTPARSSGSSVRSAAASGTI